MTLNWRKPIILAALHLSGSKIPLILKEIDRVSLMSREEIIKYQEEMLKLLLLHAYQKVPYYHRILPESGVISDGDIHLENFSKIPLLTKDIIRKEGKNLYSSDYLHRKPYENTSGGSTGEPVRFIQDKEYDEWNIATKIHFNRVLGKQIGDREIKFWGSERDIIEGTIGIKNIFYNYLYNRYSINSLLLSQENLEKIVKKWEEIRPYIVWSYLSSAIELAQFIKKNNIVLKHPPKGIIVTAAVLFEPVRQYLEDILKTRIYNQYGSREVGVIASECLKQEGLHIFDFFQYVELIKGDHTGNGEIIITNLRNYSMPLIRYQIGDTATRKTIACSCGMKSHMLSNVTGRTTDHFILKDGTRIGGAYFSRLFLFKPWIKKYQVIQRDYQSVVCRIVPDGEIDHEGLKVIEQKIQIVMGDTCKVVFDIVNDIESLKSGKYRYVICEITKKDHL